MRIFFASSAAIMEGCSPVANIDPTDSKAARKKNKQEYKFLCMRLSPIIPMQIKYLWGTPHQIGRFEKFQILISFIF